MTKKDIIKKIANNSHLTQSEAEMVVSAFLSILQEGLAAGEKINLVGFGTFDITERSARKGRNPQTGQDLMLDAFKCPKFKASKTLKDAVNK